MSERERKSPGVAAELQRSTLAEVAAKLGQGEASTRTRSTRSRSVTSGAPDVAAGANGAVAAKKQEPDFDPSRDDRDDSEAETVLSSPVKRREALKKSNGIKTEPDQVNTSIDARIHSAPTTSKPSLEDRAGRDSSPGGTIEVAMDDTPRGSHFSNARNRNRNGDGSEGESDLSDLTDHKPKARSGSSKPGRAGSEPHGGRDGLNPRKRKHRESSLGRKRLTADATKRQRRSSANDANDSNDSDRSSEEPPPARSLRHKRNDHDNGKDDALDGSADGNQNGRSRRSASHLLSRDDKSADPVWDSDSDSGTSAQPSQGRATRSINRSVSTPGRPMGREHKRHVNKYGFTRLAEACEGGDLDAVKEWLDKDRDQLEICEFAGNSPLQIASLNGYPEIVQFLLDRRCNKDCANIDNDTPLIDAVENGHSDVVQVLLAAGVDPLHQNRKGQQALDVITDQTEDGPQIREMLKKAIEDRQQKGISIIPQAEAVEERTDRLGPKQGLHFMARTPENLLKLVSNTDRNGVIEFLNARVPVDNNIVAAAAKTGDLYLLNLLLADMSPRKAKSKADKPMLAVLGTSHFEVVKTLTELEQFDPTWRSRASGMTWYEYAVDRSGPHWKQERDLLYKLYTNAQATSRLSSSPISDFKNSVRRQKSPALSKESDGDMEDGESPDASRIKRRLVSRKNMRAATRAKSPSTDSSRAASSPEAVMKPSENDDSKPVRRKPGRPRTKSLSSSQAVDVKTKRIKATRENIALFDASQGSGNKSRKPSSSSNSRPAAESVGATKKAVPGNNEDTIMTDAKAEEERQAEAAKKEAEEQARREEAEKVAREAAEAQRRVEERKQKLEGFPSALRHAMEVQEGEPAKLVRFLAERFLPLQAIPGAALGLEGDDRDAPWMVSYQAAGLLRGRAADELFNLPASDGTATATKPLFVDFTTHPVTQTRRKAVHMALGSTRLAEQMPTMGNVTASADPHEANKAFRACIALESRRFVGMEPLVWIKVKDFLAVKAQLQLNQAEQYPHLEHLPPLKLAFDTRLDGWAPTTSTAGSGSGSAVDAELQQKAGQGLKEGDGQGISMYTGGVKKMTQVDVVVEESEARGLR